MYGFVDTQPTENAKQGLSLQTIFNQINLDEHLTDEDGSFMTLAVNGRNDFSYRINSIAVPGGDGEVEQDDPSLDSKTIVVEYKLKANSNELLREKFNQLNGLLKGSKVELKFTDEDALFYTTPRMNGVPEERSNDLVGTIEFYCSDPYKYGPEQTVNFSSDTAVIENPGTAEAKPITEITVKEPVTFAMISNGEQYNIIGRPREAQETPKEPYPEVDRWFMDNLTGWSHMTEGFFLDDEVTGGTVSGSNIGQRDGYFYPESYGSQQSGWYGPAVRTSLSKPIEDFSITLGVSAHNDGEGMGKVMAIFLDENDDIVASIGLINSRLGTKNMRVLARMNDGDNIRRQRIFDYPGDSGPNSTVFNDRPLNIQLRREGNLFTAKTWQVRDGRQHARHSEQVEIENEDFQRPIRQVVLFFAKYGSVSTFPMRILGLRVHESLRMADYEIPYIAQPEDIITFDHDEEVILINGEPRKDLKTDFGASYFDLGKGYNTLATMPAGAFDGEVKFKPRFR